MKNNENMKMQINVLTKSLREDKALNDLRNCLKNKGIVADKVLQGTYFESEEKFIYGIIVTDNKKVYQYEYSLKNLGVNERYFDLLDITNNNQEYTIWPEIIVCLEMIDNNEL